MSGQCEFIKMLTTMMENLGIPYMLTGSVCSGFHGEPRSTNDVDLVISCGEEQVLSFVEAVTE